MNKWKNQGWSKNDIRQLLIKEHPDWSEEMIYDKTIEVFKTLNNLNGQMRKNNRKYYKNNILDYDTYQKYNNIDIEFEIERNFDNYHYIMFDYDLN